jgi:hypothetical protein
MPPFHGENRGSIPLGRTIYFASFGGAEFSSRLVLRVGQRLGLAASMTRRSTQWSVRFGPVIFIILGV